MGEIGSFPTTHLWVRAINILPYGMISDIGELIGNTIEDCIYVKVDEKGCCMGIYM